MSLQLTVASISLRTGSLDLPDAALGADADFSWTGASFGVADCNKTAETSQSVEAKNVGHAGHIRWLGQG